MTANGNEAVTLKQLKSTFSAERGDINLDSTATGDEVVTLKQLKMLRGSLTDDILGQFSDELDTIIGADTTPIPDAIAWADRINGEDVSGGSGGGSGDPVQDLIDYAKQNGQVKTFEYATTITFSSQPQNQLIVVVTDDTNRLIGTFISKVNGNIYDNGTIIDNASGFEFSIQPNLKRIQATDVMGMAPMYVYNVYVVTDATIS